jgi:uncharacterized protein YwlG (UPF0340 family)
MNSKFPQARYDDIVVQEVAEEVLVCNLTNNHVSCLNVTSAEIWKLCNGKRSVAEITRILQKTFSLSVTEDLVLLALDQFSRENLLVEKVESNIIFNNVSRREVIKRVGLASMIALPMVSSIVMPTAAQAQSGCTIPNAANGCPCASTADCATGLTCCITATPTCNSGC